MILNWCRTEFSTSRIVASKCYKQAHEFFDSATKKKNLILGVRDRIQLSKEDCAKFWGIEMEFKVKKILRYCFALVIDETETFHHSKDKTIVARPDGFLKSGLTVSFLPPNLETSFELKSNGKSENWLNYESKAPISGQVPKRIKRDYYLQCCLEMACTGCKATLFNVWTPTCFAMWIIYWDQEFWDTILKPLYFEAKANFDESGNAIDNRRGVVHSFDDKLNQLETRTAEEYKTHFDQSIDKSLAKNSQMIFLAQKVSYEAEWRFETCPVAPDQPPTDLTKVTSIPVIILDDPDRKVMWQQTPNLELFKTIQQTIFVKK
jgi:hypothetical protein